MAEESSLGHLPGEKWAFDAEVTQCFGDMLERSIPQYAVMREAVFEIGKRFVRAGHEVMDIGASRGEALAPFVQRYGTYHYYSAVETSPPMLAELRKRWPEEKHAPQNAWKSAAVEVVRIVDHDLRAGLPPPIEGSIPRCLVLSVLSLQFVPIEYRLKIVRDVYRSLAPGGAFVLVEKVLGATADLDAAMAGEHLAMKRKNGYSQEEIDRKRLSLEGVLVPVTSRMNEEFLRSAGFVEFDVFWRWMNFSAWLAVKS